MKTWSTLLLRGGLASGAVLCALIVGCQGQQEGDRCSLLNGNNDCVGDLVCTAASSLRLDDGVNRCCPDSGTPTDERCLRRISTDGTGGMGGMGGNTGSGGSSTGGAPSSGGGTGDATCRYNSDCDSPLVCGPGGVCQAECLQSIDCPDGYTCTRDKQCVANAP